ncbi:MAG: NAD(P)/FAD-dependent oxidoreductase [Burkholderiales bacterium]|nr:NAD(P)/FAD-dependent oxidoreductase [Burkholderiales bacterium]MBH2017258.1 NAD(P)/FAD-dependent oxidoreductase [Burkholderiales bacterium]
MIQTDALVIGAGPVGLFQAFQLGLLGLKVEVVDVLPQAGGQCMALYPDKPIYDVPGVPRCTGRELTGLLLQQASPFLPIDAETGRRQHLHLGHLVESIEAAADGSWLVGGSGGWRCQARALVVSAGAGAFVPRGLGVAALDGAHNVSHHLPDADGPDHAAALPTTALTPHLVAPPWAGQHLVVAGGGEEALSAVLAIAHAPHPEHRPARLSLLHRRDAFQAEPQQEAAVRELIAQGRVQLVIGLPQAAQREGDRVSALELLGADGQVHTLAFDHLLVRLGLSPKLGPLTQWGLDLERKQVRVDTATFASSQAGVHAVGDINTYPGKKRLLLCGFHEATLAAHAIATALQPDAPPHLLYTTTSPVLHQRLGV